MSIERKSTPTSEGVTLSEGALQVFGLIMLTVFVLAVIGAATVWNWVLG